MTSVSLCYRPLLQLRERYRREGFHGFMAGMMAMGKKAMGGSSGGGTKITPTKYSPGRAGDRGLPGLSGPQGAAGRPAQDGTKGPSGPPGGQGQTGPDGEIGPDGGIGPQGQGGVHGKPGTPGVPGEKGESGTPGWDGAQVGMVFSGGLCVVTVGVFFKRAWGFVCYGTEERGYFFEQVLCEKTCRHFSHKLPHSGSRDNLFRT